jgi:ATP-dependent helicase/nuclease subunit A
MFLSMSNIVDASERAAAIDVTQSFCVSAPAGSGKTELLIQRYLALLARVQRPEQVLAITFTRKAAAEMRARVVEALQTALDGTVCSTAHQQVTRELALLTLAANEREGWQILRDITRLNIRTIDSFCAWLTRQMPILSQVGGQAQALDDPDALYVEAVLELYKLLDDEHPVAVDLAALLLHFDNNWERLQELLVSMLYRREQWKDYVGVHAAPQEAENYLVTSVETLVREELTLLSGLVQPYKGQLLDLMHYAAGNLGTSQPGQFPGNQPEDLAVWRQVRTLLLTKTGGWRKNITKKEGFPTGKGEAEQRKQQLKELLPLLAEVPQLHAGLMAINTLPVIESGSASWQLVLHLSRLLPVLAAELLLVFRRRGLADHSQLALSALQALGTDDAPTELALRLDYQIEHILVDEFQDTAINQFELIHKLTRGWGDYNAAHPQSPRTLMIVGDGMQSIYAFRGANVGLFLKARKQGFNGVLLQHLELRCNFRSDAGVVEWVNESFLQAFPQHNDINRAQVKFSAATAVRGNGRDSKAVALHAFAGDTDRLEEVAFIGRHISDLLEKGVEGTIAVLGRNRSHLQPIINCLKQLSIPYNAPDLDSLAQSPLVADMMTLCSALANDADRLAWLALLRAPWCGLQLADLLIMATRGRAPPFSSVRSDLCHGALLAELSDDGRERLRHVVPVLQRAQDTRDRLGLRAWVEQAWVGLAGPACASDAAALRDAESFLQLLEEAEVQGIGVDVEWLSRQLERRYMSGGDPLSPVHLMTLHKAKGLEFGHVIIPALDRVPRGDDRPLLRWDEHSSASGERRFFLAADDHSPDDAPTLYNYLKAQSQQKARHEATRLLYVGTTRAVSQLLLTACVKWDEKSDQARAPTDRSLLSRLWPAVQEQMILHQSRMPEVPSDSVRPHTQYVRIRLERLNSVQPAIDKLPLQGPDNVPEVPDNVVDRSVGTVVHLALEELSQCPQLPLTVKDHSRTRWRMALQREGLWGEALESAWKRVLTSVEQTLKEEGMGRWVLSNAHLEARSEWALTAVDLNGAAYDLIIDRTFIDASSGERWVVDYKNSLPLEGESLAVFAARESAVYGEQLRRYRDALYQLGSEPLRCALFFTALGHLHRLPDLDLPAINE